MGEAFLAKSNSCGAIKNIQRGEASVTTKDKMIDVTINQIDMNKSILIVEPYAIFDSSNISIYDEYKFSAATGKLLNNNTIRIYIRSDNYNVVLWQVIEFY